ncbi:MAG: hypothetical protein ACM3VY_00530 [Candidatus Bathyarchaeota archaeon]
MNAFAQTAPRLCRDDGHDAQRQAALEAFDAHLDNLKRCIHWLVAKGVAVLDVDMKRGRARPVVTVAAAPLLHILVRDDCANVGRRQEGALTHFAWQAVRFDITIVWEEVEA